MTFGELEPGDVMLMQGRPKGEVSVVVEAKRRDDVIELVMVELTGAANPRLGSRLTLANINHQYTVWRGDRAVQDGGVW